MIFKRGLEPFMMSFTYNLYFELERLGSFGRGDMYSLIRKLPRM